MKQYKTHFKWKKYKQLQNIKKIKYVQLESHSINNQKNN